MENQTLVRRLVVPVGRKRKGRRPRGAARPLRSARSRDGSIGFSRLATRHSIRVTPRQSDTAEAPFFSTERIKLPVGPSSGIDSHQELARGATLSKTQLCRRGRTQRKAAPRHEKTFERRRSRGGRRTGCRDLRLNLSRCCPYLTLHQLRRQEGRSNFAVVP